MKPTLSIIIPAFNEELGLRSTVERLVGVLGRFFEDFELLIVNDGSRDRTGEIADQLAVADGRIRVIHHRVNMGLGYSYREGIRLATKDHVWWIPGDGGGLTAREDLENIFGAVGQSDMVLVYLLSENRPRHRQLISRTYTAILNLFFGLKVKYYNGANIYRRELLRDLPMTSNGHGLLAEISLQLIKGGYGYVEVGMHNREPPGGSSNALRLKNIVRVGKVLFGLYWRIQVKGNRLPKPTPIGSPIDRERPRA
jgi:glycosyltransferase involved in cell wall biosynthesis